MLSKRDCGKKLRKLEVGVTRPNPRNRPADRETLAGDIILYDAHLAVYKHTLDLIFYLIGGPSENELMLSSALNAFSDAVSMLLRNTVEKRSVLENLDLVLLCLDETVDDGCALFLLIIGILL